MICLKYSGRGFIGRCSHVTRKTTPANASDNYKATSYYLRKKFRQGFQRSLRRISPQSTNGERFRQLRRFARRFIHSHNDAAGIFRNALPGNCRVRVWRSVRWAFAADKARRHITYCVLEYIVHGSIDQNDSNFKLTLERVCRKE